MIILVHSYSFVFDMTECKKARIPHTTCLFLGAIRFYCAGSSGRKVGEKDFSTIYVWNLH